MPPDTAEYISFPEERDLATFLLLACLLSWTWWLGLAASAKGWIPFQVKPGFLGSFGPAVAAAFVARSRGGRAAVAGLWRPLAWWRVRFHCYVMALLSMAAIHLLALLLCRLLGGSVPRPLHLEKWYLAPPIFLAILIAGGPLGEEPGWRGFALPRLLRRYSPLMASMILGLMWLVWHLPLFWVPGAAQQDISLPWFGLTLMAYAVLFTWLYLRSVGSLLLCTLFHAANNTTYLLVPLVFRGVDSQNAYNFSFVGLSVAAALLLLWINRSEYFRRPDLAVTNQVG